MMCAQKSSCTAWRITDWNALGLVEQRQLLLRPGQDQQFDRGKQVAAILAAVQSRGDDALRDLTEQLDGCRLQQLRVEDAQFDVAAKTLPSHWIAAMQEIMGRIENFHRACMQPAVQFQTAPGVVCKRVARAIGRVGLYVPAGSAPLPSTALMLGIPARLAGCRDIVLCTPPGTDGRVDPAVLVAARMCGIEQVFRLGGAQAIAAMACGTESVPACDKLFGPGNAWVTEAKQQAAMMPGGPAIDMPAGPSEVLVIADDTADPAFVAADLLSQAEHGPDSQCLLLSDSARLLDAVAGELVEQLDGLPRADIASQSLDGSHLVRTRSLQQAVEISNRYAPEHLILQVANPRALLSGIEHAGSVFVGRWAPESVGDYGSGTNHVLPTGGHARSLSGLSVDSFRKYMTVQELSAEGLCGIGPAVMTLARAEGLEAHARAVAIRLQRMGQNP